MNGSNLRRATTLVIGLVAAPLALAQAPPQVAAPPPFAFIGMMAGFGMLMVLGIIAITLFHDRTKRRERLALVEKLVTTGQPVPRELMMEGPAPLPLIVQQRRDMRFGVSGLCWAMAIAVAFYFTSGGQLRAVAWGLFPLILGLGSFAKAWLTAREIARVGADGSR